MGGWDLPSHPRRPRRCKGPVAAAGDLTGTSSRRGAAGAAAWPGMTSSGGVAHRHASAMARLVRAFLATGAGPEERASLRKSEGSQPQPLLQPLEAALLVDAAPAARCCWLAQGLEVSQDLPESAGAAVGELGAGRLAALGPGLPRTLSSTCRPRSSATWR